MTVINLLPRDLDVPVYVSKKATELASVFTNVMFLTIEPHNTDTTSKVWIYSSSDADQVGKDFGTDSGAYFAALAFCSQSPRPSQFLIGSVDETADFMPQVIEINEFAERMGVFVYGWTLHTHYRDKEEQKQIAEWTESRTGVCSLASNYINAKSAMDENDLAIWVKNKGLTRTGGVEFTDHVNEYPDVAKLAVMLSVDYSGKNTVKTLKFKDYIGITPVNVSLSELNILLSKGYDCFTLIGNGSRTARNGRMAHRDWYWDERIGIDNYKEEVQVAYFNVLLRNGIVGYNPESIVLLQSALAPVNAKYTRNGLATSRQILDENGETVTLPPFKVEFQPLDQVTEAQRAARIGMSTQIHMTLNKAQHTLPVNIIAE